jgi:hypothetical protein
MIAVFNSDLTGIILFCLLLSVFLAVLAVAVFLSVRQIKIELRLAKTKIPAIRRVFLSKGLRRDL